MADSQTQISTNPGAADADPLAKLHKMSTTAGLGSGDYVAVNVVAVVSALFGVASFLSRLNNALLIIPILGLFCGLIAFRQISRSNGTQTGRGVAAVGLILSLAFGGFVIVQQGTDFLRTRADQNEIAELVSTLGQNFKSGDYDAAYKLFDENFKDQMKIDKFKSQLNFFKTPQMKELFGELTSMEWNGHLQFDDDLKTGEKVAGGVALVRFEKKEDYSRQGIFFRKIGPKWKIDAMPDLFPPPKSAQPGQ